MQGGGGLAIWRWSGGRRKRWRGGYDDGGRQGAQFTRAAFRCRCCPPLRHCPTPDWRRPAGMGMRRLRSTPTTAPNPPHTTCPNPWGRGRCARELSQHMHLNALDTQPHSGRTVRGGGGWEVKLAPRACWHGGGNTPQTPTLWPVECEAEDLGITPTEPGRRLAPGGRSYRWDRGAMGAQPCHGGWGRQGSGKGRKLRTVQGGCTLSLPREYSQWRMVQTAPITNRNHSGFGICRWDRRP